MSCLMVIDQTTLQVPHNVLPPFLLHERRRLIILRLRFEKEILWDP